MTVVLSESNIKQGSSGLITGEIYFEDNNRCFPERGWRDFPVIILGWWISSFLNTVKHNLQKFEFCFMDGPFVLVGILTKDETYEVSFLRQRGEDREQIVLCYANRKEIQDMLMRACRKLFRIIELSDIPKNRLSGLKGLFNELKELQL